MNDNFKLYSRMTKNVSRETFDVLSEYHNLIIKWNSSINLISKSDINNIWGRHILDSVQLAHKAPNFNHWLDIGSGGGLPGVVVACIFREEDKKFTFIESDKRKAGFLQTCIAHLKLNACVKNTRIETAIPVNADILSARALAKINILLEYSVGHLSKTGTALFLKGENYHQELIQAQQNWCFSYEEQQSITNPKSVILSIRDISRVLPESQKQT